MSRSPRGAAPAMAAALLLIAIPLTQPMTTHADTLELNATAAAECPACATPSGGAQVVNYLEQLAPQTLPLTPPDGAAAPAQGWAASAEGMVADQVALESATGAAAEAADGVIASTVAAEEAAGAIPALCSTGIACPAALAVGAFGAGYVIGTGIKALYFKFHGGDETSTVSNVSQLYWRRWQGPGDFYVANSTANPVVHPGEYYLTYTESNPFGSNIFSYAWRGAITGNQCRFGPTAPRTSIVRSGTTQVRCSSSPPQPIVTYVRTPEMFVNHHRPPVPAGGSDTSGATSVPAPPAPPRSAFGDAATTVLNDPASHDFRLWLEHQLSPRCNADPTKSTVNVPFPLFHETVEDYEDCLEHLGLTPARVELSETILDADADEPVLSSPGDDAAVSRGTTVRVYVNPPSSRPKMRRDERCRPTDSTPAGDPGPYPGSTSSDPRFQSRPAPALSGYPGMDLLAASPRTIHLWWGDVPTLGKGWGYRHIMDRRGYGVEDESDTAAALLDPSPVPVDPVAGTSYLFHKLYDVTDPLTSEIVHCARTVLVNFFQRDVEPAPRDIITSYYGMYDA